MPPRVSLCLIVKDEERNLQACLNSAAGLVHETIVVDTGSTDGTRDLARRLGAQVHDFPWVDSFAAARNESLRLASGDWIFWLDADDRLDEENRAKLQALFASLQPEMAGYSMQCRCLPNARTGTAMIVDHIRLFPNHPEIRWQYRVHEQIVPAIERLGGVLRPTGIVIHHAGYLDEEQRRRKNERNLRLLQLEQAEHPNDPIVLFHLGWTHLDLGRPAEAIAFLQNSLLRSGPALSSMRKAYALLVNSHYGLGQKREAFAVCQEARARFAEDAELLYMEGVLRAQLGDAAGAEMCLRHLLGSGPGQQLVAIDAGVHGHLAHQQLGDLYFQQGRLEEAETEWRAVVAERPDYTDAWLGLGEIWRRQGRLESLAALEEAATRLEANPAKSIDAVLLRSSVHMARKEFGEARRLLEDALTRAPQAVPLHVCLSHVLLTEGRDWAAAEQCLRQVLELDPGNAGARHNLDVLLRLLNR